METYDLEPEQILDWAVNYANYEDLETVAKAVYALYVERRKKEQPEAHKQAKNYRKKYGR